MTELSLDRLSGEVVRRLRAFSTCKRRTTMKIKFLFILVLGLLAVQPASSQTVAYSLNDTPLFTVRMPDGWKFESRPNPRNPATKSISGSATKRLLCFGVWLIKDVKTDDKAYKYVQATARTLITDARETKPA